MRIAILAVGRDRRGPTSDLVDTYVRRCPWLIETLDIAPCSNGPVEHRLMEESTRLRRALPKDAAVIALDEHGADLDSRAIAEQIDHCESEGKSALAFVIGGADGLSPALIAEADFRLAFGRATWPHKLVRAMLAEQIYRASTILTGHPYHRN